jgi:putative nucleotidyltransferase with HDIG domain
VASAIENARLHETNRKTFYQTIRALAQALEMRDSYTHGHSERVRTYATEIARLMELSPRDIEILEQAALLHDIGKIGVRDSVLLKTASLNAEERAIIERHPVIGDSILHPVGFLREALESVLHHHEHWDGNGYPSGQKGEEIPLVARIIAVADAYDAMTSDRPYRQAMDSSAAVSEIRNGSGHHFDPVVVRAFLATIGVRMEMDSLAHGMVLPALG